MISDEEARSIKEQLLEQIEKLPEEQKETLKSKIESMDNKELEQFIKEQTKQDCIFCQIAKGKAKIYKIYEDKDFIAVLDIMPATKGHVIIMPKKHLQFLTQFSEEEIKQLFSLARKLIPFLMSTVKCLGVDLYVAQGANQRIPHLALNLIPRYQQDKLNFDWERKQADEKELKDLEKKLSSQLNEIKQEEHEQKKEVKQEKEESEAQKLMKHIHERIP